MAYVKTDPYSVIIHSIYHLQKQLRRMFKLVFKIIADIVVLIF